MFPSHCDDVARLVLFILYVGKNMFVEISRVGTFDRVTARSRPATLFEIQSSPGEEATRC